MPINKDNSHYSGNFTETGQHGGSSENGTEPNGYVYYSADLNHDLHKYLGSYPPIAANVHNQCGGKKKRKSKHRRRLTKKQKKHRRKTKHHKKKHYRRKTKKRTTRKRRQRGGTNNDLMDKQINESFKENMSSGTNQSSFQRSMNSGQGGIFSSVGGYIPTNECFDNYNHFTDKV